MINLQNARLAMAALPQAIENNQTVPTLEIDTVALGVKADYISFVVQLGATDVALTTLKVTETDTTGSNYNDVPGSLFGGTAKDNVTANPALPTALDDNHIFVIHVKLSGARKRFLKLSAVVGNGSTGAFITAIAILTRQHELSGSPSKRGITGEIIA